jgi:hypothetical protein
MHKHCTIAFRFEHLWIHRYTQDHAFQLEHLTPWRGFEPTILTFKTFASTHPVLCISGDAALRDPEADLETHPRKQPSGEHRFFWLPEQRAILNFTPGAQGVNSAPMGEICTPGRMFTPSVTRRVEHTLLLRRMEGWTEKFTPRG